MPSALSSKSCRYFDALSRTAASARACSSIRSRRLWLASASAAFDRSRSATCSAMLCRAWNISCSTSTWLANTRMPGRQSASKVEKKLFFRVETAATSTCDFAPSTRWMGAIIRVARPPEAKERAGSSPSSRKEILRLEAVLDQAADGHEVRARRRPWPPGGQQSHVVLSELQRQAGLALEGLGGAIHDRFPEALLPHRRKHALTEAHDAFQHPLLSIALVAEVDQGLLRREQQPHRALELRPDRPGGRLREGRWPRRAIPG